METIFHRSVYYLRFKSVTIKKRSWIPEFHQINQCLPSKFVHAQANTSGESYTGVANVTIHTAQFSSKTLNNLLLAKTKLHTFTF